MPYSIGWGRVHGSHKIIRLCQKPKLTEYYLPWNIDNFLQNISWSLFPPFYWTSNHVICSSQWCFSCPSLYVSKPPQSIFIFSSISVTPIFSCYNHSFFYPFLCGRTSILLFSFMLHPPFSHVVPLKLNNIHCHIV